MFNFLKITRNRAKLFILFLFVYFISAFLCNFLASLIIKGLTPQAQIDIIIQFFQILNLFVVSYILLVFLKKEFFLKKYLIDFTKVFLILFISEKLSAATLFLSYKFLPVAIYFSNFMQLVGIIVVGLISYMAICCVDSLK